MEKLTHRVPEVLTKAEAEKELASNDPKQICRALVAITLNEEDWFWVQEKCLLLLESNDPGVRGLAATCLGYVFRTHGKLSKKKVVFALINHLGEVGYVPGRVTDTLRDIALGIRSDEEGLIANTVSAMAHITDDNTKTIEKNKDEKLIYQEPGVLTKAEAEKEFASKDPARICRALVAMAFNEEDWFWVQEKCLLLLESNDPGVRGLAATCLGHVARIHDKLSKEKVVFALINHLDDVDYVPGSVTDALGDIAASIKGDGES